MSTRASGAGRKKNVVPIPTKRNVHRQPPAGLLSAVAVEMWNKHAKMLAERGVSDQEHHLLLILYCNAWHYIVEADAAIAETAKEVITHRGLASEGGSGGAKTNPVFTARNIAFNQLVRAGSMLGLDPLSAMRKGAGSSDNEYNEFDEF